MTGAGGGIGRASALAFAREGASVVVADIDVEHGNETVALIGAAGGQAHFIRTDVAHAADVANMVSETVRTFGRLDIAHNNAGVAGANLPIGELPDEEWDRVMGVMLRGVFLCMKHEINAMLDQGARLGATRGAIVNTASGVGTVGYPNQSAYVSSKHGVLGLTKTGALEYGARGIRINAVCPGTVWSPMVDADGARMNLLSSAH